MMAQSYSPYSILKVKKTSTSNEIEEAWASLQKTLNSTSLSYQDAKKAYSLLIDPVKREIFDTFQIVDSVHDPVENKYNFSDNFLKSREVEMVVGRLKSTHNNQKPVFVSLNDLYKGKTVEVKTKIPKPCDKCKNFVTPRPCPECTIIQRAVSFCHVCKNTGTLLLQGLCKVCNGTKVAYIDSKTEAFVKPGMLEGQRLRCANSSNEIVLRQTSHSVFSRQGNDLYMKKKVSLAQALCGVRFVIEHLDGRKLLVTSPAGVVLFPGCRKVIRKEGMPVLNSSGVRKGNLIILFQVSIPNSIEKETVSEIEALLPTRAEFRMPDNPETEEYNLTDFDPDFRLNSGVKSTSEAYYDDKPSSDNPLLKPKDRCAHQ